MRLILLLTLTLSLCTAAPSSAQPADPNRGMRRIPVVDELMTEFSVAWSRDDTSAVRQLFADDVVLFERTPVVGIEDVMAWAREHMATTPTLVIVPLHSEMHAEMGYQMGLWKLGTGTGVHTFVWRRQPDGSWRLSSMHIVDNPSN